MNLLDKNIWVWGVVLLSLCLTSCEGLLDKEPSDQLSLEETFKDVAGAKTALAGAYSSLNELAYYQRNMMVYPELASGNLKFYKDKNRLLEDVYLFSQTATDCSLNETYTYLYTLLNNLNNIIQYTPQSEGAQKDKNRILAEARAMRALIHFDLVRLYAQPYSYTSSASHDGIVVNLTPRLYNDLPVRATVAETYEAIINDLTEAISLFDDSNAVFSGGYSQNYFNKDVMRALLARIYLYQGNWQSAYAQANLIIISNTYSLFTNQNYVASWDMATPSTESIFEIAIPANFAGTSLGIYYDTTRTELMYAATEDVLSLFSDTDVRGRNYLFATKTNAGVTYRIPKKYNKSAAASLPVKLLRLSEMYLIRAESAAELDNFTQATEDLNRIRLRADASATALEWSDKSTLLDAILLERRKELVFEGHWLFDLIRRQKDIIRSDCSTSVCNLPHTDHRVILPIPKTTLEVNPQMIQNSGY